MTPVLSTLAQVMSDSEDLESFVRPLLEVLEKITGLECTYLTTVNLTANRQSVLFSNSSNSLQIPEGISVPWDDTLCKRSIEEHRPYVEDINTCWSEVQAARDLGIVTYLSEPVTIANGELYGTLCGVSGSKVSITDEARRLLVMFARLIARQVERERLLDKLEEENRTFLQHALTDPLTGIANRRAMDRELSQRLDIAQRSDAMVHVAFIDLDGFKDINDRYGHDAGDRFLIEMARRLSQGIRQSDMVGRYGGDEFLVLGLDFSDDCATHQETFRQRVEALTKGTFSIGGKEIEYPGASVGVVTAKAGDKDAEALIARADALMYEVKRRRKLDTAPS